MKSIDGPYLNNPVDSAAELSRLLGGSEKSPGKFMAKCPAHIIHHFPLDKEMEIYCYIVSQAVQITPYMMP
jgi:hypothetical protein